MKKNSPLKYLKIDPDKPVSFRQQFAVMITMLLVSCILFTVVYLIQTVRNKSPEVKQTAAETSSASVPESSEGSGVTEGSSDPGETKKKNITAVDAGPDILGETDTIEKYYDEINDGFLVLVNKDYSSQNDGSNVGSLLAEKNDSYVLPDGSVSLDSDVIPLLNELMDGYDGKAEKDIMVIRGYESYEDQAESYGSDSVEAPGYNEHQTGLAFDLALYSEAEATSTFDGKGNYSWIGENCAGYGFIIRYPEGKEKLTGLKYDPAHFRYVGIPHSIYITENEITLEEYLELIKGHTSDNPLKLEIKDGSSYAVYYVPADITAMTQLTVPADKEYTISGDNYSGFIVTVKL